MSNFDFGGFADIKEPASSSFLRPWGIYNQVNFAGIGDKQTGTKKDGGTWNAWDFNFEALEGKYTERIFEPVNDEDGEYNGKKIPSDFKRTQQFIAQVLSVYNPEGLNKLKDLTRSGKVKSFEQFIGLVKKLLEKPVKATAENNIQLKLQGRKNTSADGTTRQFARICGCSYYENRVLMDKFIGKDLKFTSWEEQQKKAYESATPSNPETATPVSNDIDSSNTEEISDFDSLLN